MWPRPSPRYGFDLEGEHLVGQGEIADGERQVGRHVDDHAGAQGDGGLGASVHGEAAAIELEFVAGQPLDALLREYGDERFKVGEDDEGYARPENLNEVRRREVKEGGTRRKSLRLGVDDL